MIIDEKADKDRNGSETSRPGNETLLEKKSTSEAQEQKKLEEQPSKMDREKNLDFEREVDSED